jgi:hypothetical protein
MAPPLASGQATLARFVDPRATAHHPPPAFWGTIPAARSQLSKIGNQSVVPEFQGRVLNDGIVNCDALEAFCADLGRELRRFPVASSGSGLPSLIARIESLPNSLYAKAVKRAGSDGLKETAAWEATQDLRDLSAEIRKAAAKAAKKAPEGSAEAGALRGIEGMFLGIKRSATTQQSKPQLRALAESADQRFTRKSDDGADVRPGQAYVESSAYDLRAGAGLTFPLNLIAGAAGRLGLGYIYDHKTGVNEDSDLWVQSLTGGHVNAQLNGEVLPALKVFSAAGSAAAGFESGGFIRAADRRNAFAEALKQASERDSKGLLGGLRSKSAGPAARWLNKALQKLENGFDFKVRGQYSLISAERPGWLTAEKLAKGASALPIHQAAAGIDSFIPGNAQGASIRALAEKHFPAEAQIQAVLSRHLDSPAAIRALKSKNADPIVNRSVGASDHRLERGKPFKRWRLNGTAQATASPFPLVNGTATGEVSATYDRIEMQRGNAPQNKQVNAAETQDPALGFLTYGDIWRAYGASPGGREAHPMLRLTEMQQTRFPRSAFTNKGNIGALARDVVGDGRAMSPQHRATLSALEAGLDPGILARDTEKKLRALVARYQGFAVDADKAASRDPGLSPPALGRINREIFGGQYEIGEDDKSRRDFLANAHNAFTLAAGDLDLRLTLLKAFMAAAPNKKPAWAGQAKAADDFYNVANEVLANPSLPSLLESIHRHQAVTSHGTFRARESSATAKLDVNLLDVPSLLRSMGGVASLFAVVPLIPTPAKASARADIRRSKRTSHFDPEQRGTYTVKGATLLGPPPTGMLVRLARFARHGNKRADPAGEDDVARLGKDAKAALRNLNPQDVIGNNLRGLRYENTTHKPLPVAGLQPAPQPAVSRLMTMVVNEQLGTTPNPFAYNPHTAGAILDATAAFDTSLQRVILDRLGSDQTYVQLRMRGDLGKLFVEGPDGALDIPATARAFRADRFRQEALFGSSHVPILSVPYQIASLDARNLAAPYREITGETTRYVNPTVQYLGPERRRINRLSGLAPQLAAGSGVDPTGAKAEGPLLAMLRDAERRRRDNPALLEEMRALHGKARSWTAEESLDFFTKTAQGRDYLRWFHAISKAKGAVVGDMRGDPSYAPQVNHDLFRTMPLAAGGAG